MSQHPLVQTDWLDQHLADPDLRIYDTTVFLERSPEGSARPYVIVSGRQHYDESHIPGAGFLDLTREISDRSSPFPFTMPSVEAFGEVLGRRGVSDDSLVVVYSAGSVMWATRVWWMMRASGVDRAAVLDGGWKKWCREERPVCREPCSYPAATVTTRSRPSMWASKREVAAAIDDGATCTLNALSPDSHDGSGPRHYGRPGHVPGSHNVFYGHLLDPESDTFLPSEQLRERFRASGALDAERVFSYCGGGISATMGALALTMLGHSNVAVYDGSLTEWAADPELPMVVGPSPRSPDSS